MSEFCEELYSKHIRSPLLLSMMVDIYEERALASDKPEHAHDYLTKALEVCCSLAPFMDIVDIMKLATLSFTQAL